MNEFQALQAAHPDLVFEPFGEELLEAETRAERRTLMAELGEEAVREQSLREEVAGLRRAVERMARPRKGLEDDHRSAFDLRAVERILGVHRTTLADHIAAGTIVSTRFGSRTRVARAEVERLLRDGLPPLDGEKEKPRSPRQRRASGTQGGEAAKAIRGIRLR